MLLQLWRIDAFEGFESFADGRMRLLAVLFLLAARRIRFWEFGVSPVHLLLPAILFAGETFASSSEPQRGHEQGGAKSEADDTLRSRSRPWLRWLHIVQLVSASSGPRESSFNLPSGSPP